MATITIALPDWVQPFLVVRPAHYADDQARIGLALDLASENIAQATGGPFGAAVFAQADGRLLGVGVNLVTGSQCSIAHAEMVALAGTQQALGHHDLSTAVPGGVVLASSAEPCAMCLGALPWAGIAHLLCGACDADVRAIGFDEGDKPADWPARLAGRGIRVTRDLGREHACQILADYAAGGGILY